MCGLKKDRFMSNKSNLIRCKTAVLQNSCFFFGRHVIWGTRPPQLVAFCSCRLLSSWLNFSTYVSHSSELWRRLRVVKVMVRVYGTFSCGSGSGNLIFWASILAWILGHNRLLNIWSTGKSGKREYCLALSKIISMSSAPSLRCTIWYMIAQTLFMLETIA